MNKHHGWAAIGAARNQSGDAARRAETRGDIRVGRTGQRVWATDEMLGIAVDATDYEAAEHVGPDVSVRTLADAMREWEDKHATPETDAVMDALGRQAEDERANELEPAQPATLELGPFILVHDDESTRVAVRVGALGFGASWTWTR